ncbi:2-alkenal reductase [Paenibacillus sp. Root52]|uniref:Chaperone protein DnaK n=1 Tax=Paenibacillus amylolyticus TaxID=1451 RepID=A0AAP5H7P4_PAEAM|nr:MULTISPECIES: molecular chaperone HscC [Paenibacillus]KQY92008.1 2-alkenal reductase [Paenibacillus sp. Root52]MCG7379616.1 molecular chaperone HscC [Paenibacillus sp. ACRSA]MDR6726581.1 molecular chaperone HscC [Paenibacillus amylolyticus]
MTIIGIDLGTTNSLVSCWVHGEPQIIPNALGNRLTPSVVSVDENEEIVVGEIARERLITHPERTASVFKRYMGTGRTFELGTYQFLPEELSAFILKSLKADAEAYLGETVTEAVISVPAYFNDAQRKATKRAGQLAGLQVERLLSEPTAAAIAYGLHQHEPETKFLVFDLGGGTFDVSVLELFDQIMEVKSVAGDNFLGGEDFTRLLADLFTENHQIEQDRLSAKEQSALWKQAERCKQDLSHVREGKMMLTLEEGLKELFVDRARFDLAAKPLLARLQKPVERALRDASVKLSELDAVILVGGATRMPLIYSFTGKLFGRLPANHLHPDEAVALGVGIQAAMKERHQDLEEVILTDVCPYTLGVSVSVRMDNGQFESGMFSPIIERNTVIPVSKMERYYTLHHNQTSINVDIYQGESRLAKNNVKLGELPINVPPAPAGEQAIDIRFTYDINGILEVEVSSVETGEKKVAIIQGKDNDLSQEEIAERFKALEAIKIHPRDRMENRLLLARGERMYEESLAEQRLMIAEVMLWFEETLKRQDDREIKKEAQKLKEVLDQIERVRE